MYIWYFSFNVLFNIQKDRSLFLIRGTKLQKKSHISKQSLMLYSILWNPFPLTPAISTSCTFRFSFRNLSKTFSKNSRNMIIVSVHFCALLIHFICTPDALLAHFWHTFGTLLAHFLFSYITNRLVLLVGDLYVTSRLSVGE